MKDRRKEYNEYIVLLLVSTIPYLVFLGYRVLVEFSGHGYVYYFPGLFFASLISVCVNLLMILFVSRHSRKVVLFFLSPTNYVFLFCAFMLYFLSNMEWKGFMT